MLNNLGSFATLQNLTIGRGDAGGELIAAIAKFHNLKVLKLSKIKNLFNTLHNNFNILGQMANITHCNITVRAPIENVHKISTTIGTIGQLLAKWRSLQHFQLKIRLVNSNGADLSEEWSNSIELHNICRQLNVDIRVFCKYFKLCFEKVQ